MQIGPDTGSSHSRVMLSVIAFAMVALAGAGCNPKTDAYDPSKLELKSPAAKVDTTRHTGPFASGNALNAGAELKPLDPEPVKTIQIDTTHKLIEIAPGVLAATLSLSTGPRDARRSASGDRTGRRSRRSRRSP